MKIIDTFENLFGRECTIESDDIKLTKEMLDLSRMEHDDTIWIPLKLKLEDLSKDDGGADLMLHSNEISEDDVCWIDDGDYDKSYATLGFDLMALTNGMEYGYFPNDPMAAFITIIPFSRTPDEIKAEIDSAKSPDELLNKEDVEEHGAEPYYYSDQVKERIEDEQKWFETHNDREGHYACWQVEVTPEEYEEIRKMLYSISEIKKIADKFDSACIVIPS